ncbi:L-glutamate gamma-semialdehyde dehydrogenase [Rhodococcus sp. D2-41]|uniref:L-glutamate gamma-semialdehyde dehydrogenase n=1 Tax=Speluncibacter jeojiensis TaxID=2710754 RepID=UPI002410149F|nr:L-glutamate gamma-semialdehyde dehydrogenase [Rhodococcus sp. D2-41]MDG3009697.1 L-glutamate gamma-semialdehyde dehydrogenase [Rhodococcus sp. D2-41]
MDAVTDTPMPRNEPVRDYSPGAEETLRLQATLAEFAGTVHDLPSTIGGRRRSGGGHPIDVVIPHDHSHVLGTMGNCLHSDAQQAIDAALAAAPGWRSTPFDDRAAVLLRAADLLAGPWRDRINAATMLGQSKTAIQAEIDAACELIDFWRFNVHFARELLAGQPMSAPGVWNRLDHRPLEGFVYAITPFNFTSIAGNLPTAPALMGNTVVWKPSPTQTLAATLTMDLLREAGLPDGVINLTTGTGIAVSDVALTHPDLAGIHFTGSSKTFRHLWSTVGSHIETYRNYPRIVGETGGKDFVVAHPSADPDVLRVALVRGAFEYQGQKCSAVSRAFVPQSTWDHLRDSLIDEVESLTMGDVADFANFMGALIDRPAFDRVRTMLERVDDAESLRVVAGGVADDTVGYFVRPTVVVGTDPTHEVFRTEYFGPVLSVFVYPDNGFDDALDLVDCGSPYGLTGAVIARDRSAIATATERLRYTAGNFYINDKPTGAVVGQQPFGGARASGTDDKAGSVLNLQRWVSPRTVKETFVPPVSVRYPHQG